MTDVYVLEEGAKYWKKFNTYKSYSVALAVHTRLMNTGKYKSVVVTLANHTDLQIEYIKRSCALQGGM